MLRQASKTLKFLGTSTAAIAAVVVAQLVKWLFPKPGVRSSNLVIGKFLCRIFFHCELYYIEKTKIKKKRLFLK